MSACGSWSRMRSIKAEDFLTGALFDLPIRTHGIYEMGATSFSYSGSLSALAEEIRNLSSDQVTYTVTEYPAGHLLIGIKSDEKNAVLAITQETDSFRDEPTFNFYSPKVSLQGVRGNIVFPLHLINDEHLCHWYDSIEEGVKYRTDHHQSDFLGFYTDLAEYYPQLDLKALEVTENGFIIHPQYMKGDKLTQSEFRQVRFEFYTQEGENYFSVDY